MEKKVYAPASMQRCSRPLCSTCFSRPRIDGDLRCDYCRPEPPRSPTWPREER